MEDFAGVTVIEASGHPPLLMPNGSLALKANHSKGVFKSCKPMAKQAARPGSLSTNDTGLPMR